MSVQTLYTAATGMEALQQKLDVIANNLANVNTTGFKRDRCNFEDLFYRTETLPGIQDAAGQYTPVGIQTGLGVEGAKHANRPDARRVPADESAARRGHPGQRLFASDRSDRPDSLHAGRKSFGERQWSIGRRRCHGRPAVGSGHLHSADRHQRHIGSNGTVSVVEAGSTTMQQVGVIQIGQVHQSAGLVGSLAAICSVRPTLPARRRKECRAPTGSARSSKVRWKRRTSNRSTN